MRAGPHGFFRFERLATGQWQVLTCDAELDPGTRSYTFLRNGDPIEWSCDVFVGRTTRFDLDLRPK